MLNDADIKALDAAGLEDLADLNLGMALSLDDAARSEADPVARALKVELARLRRSHARVLASLAACHGLEETWLDLS